MPICVVEYIAAIILNIPIYEQKTFWEFGNGLFPDVELNALFEQTGIGQSRQNRRDMPVPNNAGEIDKFFQK